MLLRASDAANVESAEVAGEQTAVARDAWEDLYRTYCYPVYTFIRRRGYHRPEAQDLTQDFFVHLIEKETLRRADRNKGRFRSFLLGSLEYFLADKARRNRAAKRGGDCEFVFLDGELAADCERQLAAPEAQTPERLFEARWAAALVGQTFARLREEMAAANKARLFDTLRDYVAGNEDASYQQAADELELSLPALKSAIHRLRIRYGALLRAEVARTVSNVNEVDDEVRHLQAALRMAPHISAS
jgi:RNA polymerase sigma factor (sigma-70 family)